MRRSGLPGLLGLLLLLPWAAAADVHPNTESGVAVDRAFQSGEVDHVNLFNGSLSLVLPLGIAYPVASPLSYRFTLVYNSNPWIYATDTGSSGTFTYSQPSPCSNAGLGWRLSFGAVGASTCVSRDDSTTAAKETYEAPDGSQHLFYATLHPG